MKQLILSALIVAGIVGLVESRAADAHFGFWNNDQANPENRAAHMEAMIEQKAEILGISVDELKTAREQGASILELAEQQGLTKEELHDKLMEQKKVFIEARLGEKVSNGTLSQEAADEHLLRFESHLEKRKFGKGHHREHKYYQPELVQ